MTNAELIQAIRAEIERRKTIQLKRIQEGDLVDAAPYDKNEAYNEILSFLSTLEESNFKAFPTTDEEMAKFLAAHPKVEVPEKYKTPDWMFEKSEKPMNLDFEQELYNRFGMVKDFTLGMRIAQAFYDLGCTRTAEKYDEIEYNRQRAEESPLPEDTVLFNKGVEEGKRLMIQEAVEGVVWDAGVDFAPHPVISVEDFNVKDGDKVRIIIVKDNN